MIEDDSVRDSVSEQFSDQVDDGTDFIKEVRTFETKCSHDDELNSNLLDLNLNDDDNASTPVEILSEFLSTYMSHDYISALYYCKLILLYEPDNEIVQDFYPLILEKLCLNANESDEFADNEGSSFSTKSEYSSEYFSYASAGTENDSACSSLCSDEEDKVSIGSSV